MIICGRKRYQFTLDLDSNDRQELARELVALLNLATIEGRQGRYPKTQQLLCVVETVEHGDTRGLDVTSGPEDGK